MYFTLASSQGIVPFSFCWREASFYNVPRAFCALYLRIHSKRKQFYKNFIELDYTIAQVKGGPMWWAQIYPVTAQFSLLPCSEAETSLEAQMKVTLHSEGRDSHRISKCSPNSILHYFICVQHNKRTLQQENYKP